VPAARTPETLAPELDDALARASAELAGAPRIWVALSGGLDSTVLLHLFASHGKLPLSALHLNHQLYADAPLWQRHCEALCERLGVPLQSELGEVVESGQGPEAAAREARFACFERVIGDGEVLLLAHHLDDQAETLLLRLLRGAGPDGLAAMPRRRVVGRGTLLRPLLDVPRSQLEAYARQENLSWVEDPSNTDVRFDRNYLRNEVLPLIAARWPAYRRSFARSAALMREAGIRLAADAGAPLMTVRSVVGDPGFPLAALPGDPAQAAQLVRRWLRERGCAMPSVQQLGVFLQRLGRGEKARLQTSQWVLERYRDAVYCYLPPAAVEPAALDISPGQSVQMSDVGRIELRADPGGECRASAGGFSLRFRAGGERLLQPDGSHLRLKTLFQTLAIPRWWRGRVPLLYGDGELFAVGPYRSAAGAAAEACDLLWEPALQGD
jgi:tRNA(Ile)-lysidine synthase